MPCVAHKTKSHPRIILFVGMAKDALERRPALQIELLSVCDCPAALDQEAISIAFDYVELTMHNQLIVKVVNFVVGSRQIYLVVFNFEPIRNGGRRKGRKC